MTSRLLATKFHIPPRSAASFSRPRLLQRLDAGLREQRRLTLVSAPAGYGKTTLITEWGQALSQQDPGPRIAWLSLGTADDDPDRFFRYWLAAFRPLAESVAERIEPLLSLPQLPPPTALLDILLAREGLLKAYLSFSPRTCGRPLRRVPSTRGGR